MAKKKKNATIDAYIKPIVEEYGVPYNLVEEAIFTIKIKNDETDSFDRVDVVEVGDLSTIILSAQIEATIKFIKMLEEDNQVVMSDVRSKEFKKYIKDIEVTLANLEDSFYEGEQ